MREIKGTYSGKGKKIAIVVSRFNEFVSTKLLQGCLDTLSKLEVEDKDITVIWTPGSFEIPSVISNFLRKKKVDALIALGTVIRGETPHFDYISSEVAKGIANLSVNSTVPIVFGIITADTLEQAIDRAGTKEGNKGREAAMTAVEMANLYRKM